MKMKSIVAFCAMMVSLIGLSATNPMGAVPEVRPGAWCSDFTAAKEYADHNNLPMLIFWANPGCVMCEKMENACNGNDFRAWMAESGMVFVFSYGTPTQSDKACKVFAKNSSGEYPYLCVYWKSNTAGREVKEVFSGRSGKIGHGSTTKMALDQQLIVAMANILSDWDGSGSYEPPPPCNHPNMTSKVTKQPTCTKTGVRTYTCPACGATRTETIDALGHNFVNGVCTRCKAKDPTYVPTPNPEPEPEPEPQPQPQPQPNPEPIERVPVNVASVYNKARVLTALVSQDGDPVGTAKISIGKRNAKKGTVKVGCSLSLFTGKSASTSVTLEPDEYGTIEGTFRFKSPFGAMPFELDYDAEEQDFLLTAESDDYTVEVGEVEIGGYFETDELYFSADIGDAEPPDNYDFIVDAPDGEPVYVKKGYKFSFDKAPSIKYKKEDGDYWLTGLDDDVKTNLTGLKLSYSLKTGKFTGSFTIYATNEGYTEKKPKIAKYKASVSGVIINGEGYGRTSVKIGKKTYVGSCSLF